MTFWNIPLTYTGKYRKIGYTRKQRVICGRDRFYEENRNHVPDLPGMQRREDAAAMIREECSSVECSSVRPEPGAFRSGPTLSLSSFSSVLVFSVLVFAPSRNGVRFARRRRNCRTVPAVPRTLQTLQNRLRLSGASLLCQCDHHIHLADFIITEKMQSHNVTGSDR